MLGAPRVDLGFGITTAKGLISGKVSIYDGNKQIFKGGRWVIDLFNIRNKTCKNIKWVIPHNFKYVVIMQRVSAVDMIYHNEWIKNNCILITGDGYPSLLCQKLVYILYTQMRKEGRYLPIYCFVDYDACGIDIFLTYQQGRVNAPETYLYAIPNLLYLGLEFKDISRYGLQHMMLTMNKKDHGKVASLESFLQRKHRFYFDRLKETKDSVEYLVFQRLLKQVELLKTEKKKLNMDCITALRKGYLQQRISEMNKIYGLDKKNTTPLTGISTTKMDVDDK